MSPTTVLLPAVYLSLMQFILHKTTLAMDPTEGFTSVPLNNSNFLLQKPYNISANRRYSFINGVHKFWVYNTDEPHTRHGTTRPRTEFRITGYDYTSGVWQFEGYGYVPSGTTGVSIMQVFGGKTLSTTLQLRVYNGSLTYYTFPVLEQNIYDRWFRVNVVHDVAATTVKAYIDGVLKYQGADHGNDTHYFKIGVYTQHNESHCMESRWKGIKIFRE